MTGYPPSPPGRPGDWPAADGPAGRPGCQEIRLLSVEVALGIADGADRATVLDHVAGCRACRADLRSLADTAEAVLGGAPRAEPASGLEQRVLDAIAADRRSPSITGGGAVGQYPSISSAPAGRRAARRWPPGPNLTALAAAIALVVAVAAWATRPQPAPAGPSRPQMAAALIGTSGSEVGTALVLAGRRAYLSVEVDGVQAGTYRVMVDSSSPHQVGLVSSPSGSLVWSRMISVPFAAVRDVRLVQTASGATYTSHLRA